MRACARQSSIKSIGCNTSFESFQLPSLIPTSLHYPSLQSALLAETGILSSVDRAKSQFLARLAGRALPDIASGFFAYQISVLFDLDFARPPALFLRAETRMPSSVYIAKT
jgi:hypothetical protein